MWRRIVLISVGVGNVTLLMVCNHAQAWADVKLIQDRTAVAGCFAERFHAAGIDGCGRDGTM
jgi:hypothetical protein